MVYLRSLAHLQVSTDRVEGPCATHIEMSLVERLQHFDEVRTLPLAWKEREREREKEREMWGERWEERRTKRFITLHFTSQTQVTFYWYKAVSWLELTVSVSIWVSWPS